MKNYEVNKKTSFFSDWDILLWPSLLLGLILSFPISPTLYRFIKVTSFDRVFGAATMAGIDADKRTMSILVFNTIIIPLLILIAFWIVKTISNCKNLRKNTEVLEWINTVSICGLASTILFIINRYALLNTNSIQDIFRGVFTFASFVAVVFVILMLLNTQNIFNNINFKDFKTGVYIAFALALLLNILTQRNTAVEGIKGLMWNNRVIFIFLVIGFFTILLLRNSKIQTYIGRIRTAAIPIFFVMPVCALYLELTNILNQRGIFIIARLSNVKLLAASILVLSIALCFVKLREIKSTETIYCVGIILGLSLFTIIPPLKITATTELFEQANPGMLIYDFIHYGKIPLLESFDGHMLSQSFGGVLYNIFNGMESIDGSYFIYNIFRPFIAIFVYFMLKKVFNKDVAFFVSLLVPIPYTDFFVLIILAFAHAITKRSALSWALYIASIAATAFYEMPPAAAVGIGTMILSVSILSCEILKERKFTIDAKKFFIGSGSFIGSFGIFYIILCMVKGINPVSRALEFLRIANSNRNWTSSSIGESSSIMFALLYAFIPLIMMGLLIFAIHKIFVKNEKNNLSLLVMTAFLFAYFCNYTRMLGRHSLAENIYAYAIMYVIMALLFLGEVLKSKFKIQSLVCTFLFIPMLFGGISNQNIYSEQSLLQKSLSTYNNAGIYYNGSAEKVQRVNYDEVRKAHDSVIKMIQTVMDSDETYMDLSSQTMLYALTGKEKPVYINQSVLHLSGDYTQKQFINQVESYGDKCAYALIGGLRGLDGIANNVKYYRVWEYLNEKFRPLCMENEEGYSIWVRKERYDSAVEKLRSKETFGEISVTPSHLTDANWENGILKRNDKVLLVKDAPSSIQNVKELVMNGTQTLAIESVEFAYDYQRIIFTDSQSAAVAANAESLNYQGIVQEFPFIDYQSDVHNHDFGRLAMYWGEYDKYKAYDNDILQELINQPTISRSKQLKSNYVELTITASSDCNGKLIFTGTNGDVFSCAFAISPGIHNYLIRCSVDSYWTTDDFRIKVQADGDVQLSSLNLLAGD